MSDVDVEQVNLLLKLYAIRREPRLREAREWFAKNFHPQTIDDVMKICPPGSEGNAFMRQVLSYWEMVASIANRGVIDEDLFFENTGERWAAFEQVKPVLAAWRQMFSMHRGQFSVYLRILNIAVPASWGPSADEPPLFLQNAQRAQSA